METEQGLSREQRRDLWLHLFDHNGNGRLDPEEIEEMARYRHAFREREAAAQRRQIVLEARQRRTEAEPEAPSEASRDQGNPEAQPEAQAEGGE